MGENAGQHLDHDFIPVSLITRPMTNNAIGLIGSFTIETMPKHTCRLGDTQ
jgi:hypothetical protein